MARRAPADLVRSDVAVAYIELLNDFAPDQLQLIERALLSDLAESTPAELREARLGLLMDMLADRSGVIPLADDYDRLREERAERGEVWPHSTTLLRAYSHSWNLAVRAAMRLLFDGPAARVATSHRAKHTKTSDYERDEVKAALRRFHREHGGRWPRPTQFYDWAEYVRQHADYGGHPDPRLPSPSAVKRHFGTFDAALVAAQRPV